MSMDGTAHLFCQSCRSRTQHNQAWGTGVPDERMIGAFGCVACGRIKIVNIPQGNRRVTDDEVVYPSTRRAGAGVPENVRAAFEEASATLTVGSFNLAAQGFRTALQLACREKGAKGKDLKAEINDLASKHAIPPDLAEWAHQIRDDGNAAAHPADVLPWGEQDANELLALTESIFEYLFVVPAGVATRRARLTP